MLISKLLKKSSFPGCSKRARCKAPEILRVALRRIRSDFLPRRRVGESARGVLRETQQMAFFQQPVRVVREQAQIRQEVEEGKSQGQIRVQQT